MKRPAHVPTQENQAIELFLATIPTDSTLDEAILNLERDAEIYGWSRLGVRRAASAIRLRFARKP